MKKTLSIIILSLLAMITFAQQSTTKIQRFGAGVEITGIGGSGFAYGGTIEYKFLTQKAFFAKNHLIGGNLLVGATLAEGIHLLVGGGYDQNITYERGQVYAIAKFNTPVIALSGKLLLSNQQGYKNNYEIAGTFFPGQNIVGIGGFYLTDYDCTVIGAKLTVRFGKTNGSSAKKRNDCTICGL